jgi:hypothetical protein
MTDSSADRDPKDSDHIEPSFSAAGGDSKAGDGAHGAAASEAAGSANAAAAKEPSKEIVLQRLTPHSSWDDPALGAKPSNGSAEARSSNTRRYLSMAAVIVLAALVGAVGGSAATFGIAHYLSDDDASVLAANQYRATQSAVAKLTSDVAALKTSAASHADRVSKIEKLEDRVSKVEKAQAEPAAKLAKLSEAVEKLRAAEATGSVAKPAAVPPAPTPAPVVSRLPVVNGWTLLGVDRGSATVEGRDGVFEVFAGDPLPGVGRVDAIRRQDGRWVVVTSRGLIVAR